MKKTSVTALCSLPVALLLQSCGDRDGTQADQSTEPAKVVKKANFLPAAKFSSGEPIELVKNQRIAFVGGGLGSRMNIYNEFETELQLRHPDSDLYIRNLCKEGDTPGFRPHPSRADFYAFPGAKELVPKQFRTGGGKGHYKTPDEWLTQHKIDVVVGFFGYTESFEGKRGVDLYKQELRAFIKHTLSQKYNGNSAAKLAIVSPAAFEDQSNSHDVPNGAAANRNIEVYTKAMAEVCKEEGVLFFDAYSMTKGLYEGAGSYLTSNGHNLNRLGYKAIAPAMAERLFGLASTNEQNADAVFEAVKNKNEYWKIDYKIPNGVHVHGRRYKPFGDKNYPEELQKIREYTDIRDKAIWASNKGKSIDVKALDAETTQLTEIETNSKRPNEYKSGKEVGELLQVAEGFKVELFACEKDFPQLENPSQMAFDNEGRLWVGCMGAYPHYKIGDPKPKDSILIFEDTDNDGKADKVTPFVENIHIPMGFEITEHGCFVSLGTDLVLFKDTNGDSRADTKEYVLSGFDDHDTHHAISSFCADPSGAVYMAEGTFLHSNVETPHGTVRGTNGGFYRYNHTRKHLERTAQYRIPNPWGIAFDDWGQNFFLHTSGTAFAWMQRGAVKPRYNVNLRAPQLLTSNAVRPTSGVEFVSSRHFPEEMQGDVLICNNIGFLGCKQHKVMDTEDGFWTTEYRQDLFKSSDEYKYFRPVDLEFAPDGSLFFIDWSNVLIGHMQHSARDPKRDHSHGRIYRVTYPERKLVKPAKIAGAGIPVLLENLKKPEIRTRYRTRRELRGRDADKVAEATASWAATLDKGDTRYEHHLLEALWVTWGVNRINVEILEQLLSAKSPKARAAAVRAVRYNADKLERSLEYFKSAAKDEHAQVRHEAIIQASWLNKRDGLAVLDSVDEAIVDAKWSKEAFKAAREVLEQVGGIVEVHTSLPSGYIADSEKETSIQINCVEEGLAFDVKEIELGSNKKINIKFTNPDVMLHNFVVVSPGAADKVEQAAIDMGAAGMKKSYVPNMPEVLAATKLLETEKEQTLEITFEKPGKYPFLCTFPGHGKMMRGYFVVVKDKPVVDVAALKAKLGKPEPVELKPIKLEVNCATGLKFKEKALEATVGAKVTIQFNNPDVMTHNLLIVKPGTADKVAKAAMDLGGQGMAKGWVPDIPEVIAATKLVNANGNETLEITFEKPGDYQFICSFPGHAGMMRGVLTVKEAPGIVAVPAVVSAPKVKAIEINCMPGLQFKEKEFKFAAGEKIKLTLNNPDAMQHNLVVVKPGTEAEVAAAAMNLGGKGMELSWIPDNANIIASTKLVNSKGSETIEFTIDKPGKYAYICSFPGHAGMMKGVFIVE